MRELLIEILEWFKSNTSPTCGCHLCKKGVILIAKIEKELNDTSPKIDASVAQETSRLITCKQTV